MARCSRNECRRWRPDASVRMLGLGARVDHAWYCSNACVKAEAVNRLTRVEAGEQVPAAVSQPVPSIDPGAVRLGPGQLSADQIRALGVVPFAEEGNALQVACRRPLPTAALSALQVMTGRTVEPYIVADDTLEGLQKAYGAALDGAHAGAERRSADGQDGPPDARLDPFTWVRIAPDGQVSTLLVRPLSQEIEEHESWLAATTPH